MRRCMVLTGLAVVLMSCHREPARFSAQDESAVRAVADSVVRYLKANDLGRWAGLFSENAILQPPNAPAAQGRSAIQAYAKSLPSIEQITFTDMQVWGEGDLAYGTSGYSMSLKGLPPDRGKQLWVSRRGSGGKWEVVAVSFNSNLPLPSQRASQITKRPK